MKNTIIRVGGKTFSAAFDELSAARQYELKRTLAHKCDWKSRTTFYNKKSGRSPISRPEAAIIEIEFARYGIHAWSGEKLEFTSKNN